MILLGSQHYLHGGGEGGKGQKGEGVQFVATGDLLHGPVTKYGNAVDFAFDVDLTAGRSRCRMATHDIISTRSTD